MTRPIRFKAAPIEVATRLDFSMFEVLWGVVEVLGKKFLVAVWRRKEVGSEYQPVGADFIRNQVWPQVKEEGLHLPQSDAEVEAVLAPLQTA